jgi:hypothetical protein
MMLGKKLSADELGDDRKVLPLGAWRLARGDKMLSMRRWHRW